MKMKKLVLFSLAVCLSIAISISVSIAQPAPQPPLWQIYQQSFKSAKYVDLTHTIAPTIPVWQGFGPSKFSPTLNPDTNQPYTYQADGFEATH